MNTTHDDLDQKLNALLEKVNEMHTDLQVHIAKDEDMWRRVAESEEELKELAEETVALTWKQRMFYLTLSSATGGGVATLLRMFI